MAVHRRKLAALLAAVSILAAGTASAAGDLSAARSNSEWLAKQLGPDGTVGGGALPDHSLMIDVLFALHASGDAALAEPIVDHLATHASDFFTMDGLVPGQGYEAIILGGAAAKVLVAAQVAGRDPRSFDGYDMVAETKAAIMRSGPDKGRVSDYAKTPGLGDVVTNESNVFGQALAVIGLAGVEENDRLAISTLVAQQCAEGYFRINFQHTAAGDRLTTCDEDKASGKASPDGDTTGLALSALLAARKAGAKGLDAPITAAVEWLTANQTESGGWRSNAGTTEPNTTSTGLVVQALADAGGAAAAVDRGVAYLRSAQVTPADSGNALAAQQGAIAPKPAQYVAARTTGITDYAPWVHASAQASLGLSQVGFLALARRDLPAEPPPVVPQTETPTRIPPVGDVSVGRAQSAVKVVAPPPGKKAADPPRTPAALLGAHLAKQLVNGDHIGQSTVDYNATADVVLALRALDEQPDAVARATKFLLSSPVREAEPLAKIVIIGRFAGEDVSAQQNSLRGLNPGSSVRARAWMTLASGSGADDLAARQCPDGTFPTDVDGRCGDLTATAFAVLALNSRPHTSNAPRTAKPAEWSDGRAQALESAANALTTATDVDGMAGDVAVSSAVGVARQFVGLNAGDTTKAIGHLVGAGGVPGDLAANTAAAQVVAGRSWLSADGSPVSPVVRLPLVGLKKPQQVVPPPVAQAVTVPTRSLVIGLGGIVAVLVLAYFARRLLTGGSGARRRAA